jgi:peptidyl-prolyl cis-trans isomerase B (cyclophilin B)
MRATSVIACTALTVAGLLTSTSSAMAAPKPLAAAGTTTGPCKYTATPEDPSPRPVSLPPDPAHTPDQGF